MISLPDFEPPRLPDAGTMFRPYTVTSFKDKPLPPITADDLIDAGGRCAGAIVQAQPSEQPAPASMEAASPDAIVAAPVALEMSECEVVRRTGPPQRVEIGGDGGERIVTLTYTGGARPGIYHFAGGRLKSMERGAEPPPQLKPTKPTKRAARSKKTAER